jgi:hypothetical protein
MANEPREDAQIAALREVAAKARVVSETCRRFFVHNKHVDILELRKSIDELDKLEGT